jgi:hypothetical protein
MRNGTSIEVEHDINVKSTELREALRSNSTSKAISLIEELITQHDHYLPVKNILFVKKYRPKSIPHLIVLLRFLSKSPLLHPTHRVYADIALAYQALNLEDKNLAGEMIEPLKATGDKLALNPDTYKCQRPNRRNKFKLFISVNTCLFQLHLLCGNFSEPKLIANGCHIVLNRLSFDQLPAEVSYRAMSNFARLVCLQPSSEVVKQDLALLSQEARRTRHNNHPASENHRDFLENLQNLVAQGSTERLSKNMLRKGTSPQLRAQLILYFSYLLADIRKKPCRV